jgi:hypothetical protein
LVNLDISLSDLIQDDVSDLTVKLLGSITNDDETVRAQQLFFKEVLIFVITLHTAANYETDTPEVDWDRQLDIVESAHDLKNVLGMASLIQTKSRQYNDVLMNVRMKMPFAKNQAIHYCNLDIGHLYRFGNGDNYLFVIDPPKMAQEDMERFIFNDLSYILSLNLIIKENNRQFLNYQEELHEIDKEVQQNISKLPSQKQEDPIMLAIRKDHISELEKKALKIQSEMQKFAEQLKNNLMKSDTLLRNIKLVKDNIFLEDYDLFHKLETTLQEWLKTSDEVYTRIFTGIKEYSNQISKLLEEEEKPYDRPMGKPKVYLDSTSNDEVFPIGDSPYKQIKEEYETISGAKSELLETIPLEWCSSYILIEPQPNRSLKLFSDLVSNRFLGLCITRNDPEVLINQYQLKYTPIYQINTESGENTVPPVLSKISQLINEFLTNNIHSVIYLDGLEYLIQANDLNRVVKFVNNIKESIVLNDSILIFALNESSLNENDLSLFLENSINISNCDVEFEDII